MVCAFTIAACVGLMMFTGLAVVWIVCAASEIAVEGCSNMRNKVHR